jgi:hypothetical protein
MSKYLHTSILEYTSNQKEKVSLSELLKQYKDTGDISDLHIPEIKNKKAKWLLDQLLSIIDEMRKHNISSDDYMNDSNWGYKDKSTLGVFDLGFGDYYDEFEETPDEIIIDKDSNLSLLDFIKDKMNIKDSTYIGGGFFGYAHDIGSGKILKITKDKTEAINAKKVMGKELTHIANVYDVKKFERKSNMYFIIVLEKLELDTELESLNEELKKVFDMNKTKLLGDSIISDVKNKYHREFLEDITKIGREKTWSKWRDIISKNEELKDDSDIFNDLDELSKWIMGSVTNDNDLDDEPPFYVMEFLNEIT